MDKIYKKYLTSIRENSLGHPIHIFGTRFNIVCSTQFAVTKERRDVNFSNNVHVMIGNIFDSGFLLYRYKARHN